MTGGIANCPSEAASGRFRRRFILFGGLLTSMMMVASTMQFALGALGPNLKTEFAWSNSEIGLINLCYFTLVAGFSILVPRGLHFLSARSAAMSVAFLSASGLIVVAQAPQIWVLVLGLSVAAASTGAVNPATNRSALRAGDSHATVIAFKQSGVALSTIVCGAVLPPLAQAVGWRQALTYYALIALLPVALLRWSDPPQRARRPRPHLQLPTVEYSIPRITLYAFLMGSGSATVSTYLVIFLVNDLDATPTVGGLLLSAVGVGALAGRLIWGILAVRAVRLHKPLQSHLLSMGVLAALAAFGLAVSSTGGLPWAWACAFLMGLSASSWNPVAMMIASSSGDTRQTMRASGRIMFGFFFGLAIAPPIFGFLVDLTGYRLAWSVVGMMFVAATLTILSPRSFAVVAEHTPDRATAEIPKQLHNPARPPDKDPPH